jgi:hypothetical protein
LKVDIIKAKGAYIENPISGINAHADSPNDKYDRISFNSILDFEVLGNRNEGSLRTIPIKYRLGVRSPDQKIKVHPVSRM